MSRSPRSVRQAPYERLQAWNACHQLVFAVYRACPAGSPAQDPGLALDLRRAALTAASRIARGSALGPRGFRKCLRTAARRLTDMGILLELARETTLLDARSAGELEVLRDHASRLTWGLYEAVKKREGNTRAT
jgi:four helix bundle protein